MGAFGETDVLFSYKAGGNLSLGSFARTSSATLRLRTGALSTVSSTGVTRLGWYDVDADDGWEQPAYVSEGGRTNIYTQSEVLDNAVWTKTNLTVTANAVVAPDGSTTADKLVQNGSTNVNHSISQVSTGATDDNYQSWSGFIKGDETRWVRVETRDSGNTSTNSWFDGLLGVWSTASSTKHVRDVETYANGWYRAMLSFDASTGATETLVTLHTSTGAGGTAHDGSTTDGFYAWGLQYEKNNPFVSAYVPTSTASQTRNAEALTYTIPFGLQDLSIYVKAVRPPWADLSHNIGFNPIWVEVGTTAPNLWIQHDSVNKGATAVINSAGTVTSSPSAAYPSGTTVECCAQFKNLDSAPQTRVDDGSGFASWSASATPFHAFGNTTLRIGSAAFAGIITVKIARGLKTLATMRAMRTDHGG